jgi:heme a synthase
LALHLTNTLLLLAALTLTAHLLSREQGLSARQHPLVAPFGAVACGGCGDDCGVTGSLAALGDTLFPASSLGRAGAGFLRDQRLAGALALDASHRRVSSSIFSSGCWCAPRSGNQRTGTIAGSPRWCCCCWPRLYAGRAGCGAAGSAVAAGGAPAGADTLWAALVVLTARLTLEPKKVRVRKIRFRLWNVGFDSSQQSGASEQSSTMAGVA